MTRVLRSAARDVVVDRDRLGDLVADLEHGIQRGERVLEDHRQALATQLAHLVLGEARAARGP